MAMEYHAQGRVRLSPKRPMNESNESSRFRGNPVMPAEAERGRVEDTTGRSLEATPADRASRTGAELPALQSPLLLEAGFRHAFFTRLGGVSLPPWDSLNFAAGVGDDPAAVAENVRRAEQALGLAPGRLYFLSQVHGTAFRALEGTEGWDEVVRSVGDITLSAAAGVGCGIRTADCVPILLADRRTGAVAAVHSGWRGTASRVAVTGVRALRELIGAAGAEPELIAAIGPHIEACCFEVGDDVARELAAASSAGESAIRKPANQAEPNKPHVDLRRIVRAQLEECGLEPSAIDDVPGCTVCDKERFHSFRRDRDRSGRLLSAIVARGAGLPAPRTTA